MSVKVSKLLACLYYGFIFVPTGIGISFLPLWLRENGVGVATMGALSAAGFASKILVNPLVSYFAARFNARSETLVALAAISAAISGTYVAGYQGSMLATAFLFIGIFSSPISPLGDAIILNMIRTQSLSFGYIRSWGSFSVLLNICISGLAFEYGLQKFAIASIPFAYITVLIIISCIPRIAKDPGKSRNGLPFLIIKKRDMLQFILISAPLQAVHGIFYGYSTLYWFDSGYGATEISIFWAVGILSEIIGFYLFGKFRGSVTPWAMISIAAFAGICRWGVLCLTFSFYLILTAQFLQGVTLSVLQIGVAEFFIRNLTDDEMSDATSTYSAFAYGLFQAIAVGASGFIFKVFGGRYVFAFASVICASCLLYGSLKTGLIKSSSRRL